MIRCRIYCNLAAKSPAESLILAAVFALVALASFGADEKAADRGVRPIPAELFGQNVELAYVCYFQAINEQAICVSPFESHLTSLGEAMRLWKGHVGGVPSAIPDLPENAFATDAADGSRYVTFYNFSTTTPCTVRIPTDGRGRIVAEETLVPNGLESGCRFEQRQGAGKIVGGFYELTLVPASLSCARFSK